MCEDNAQWDKIRANRGKRFQNKQRKDVKIIKLKFTTRKNVNAKYKTYKIQFVNQSRS